MTQGKPEVLSGEVVMDNLPEPPPLPEIRTFKVTLTERDADSHRLSEYVMCHSVEISPTGVALFFEYNYTVTPNGWAPESKMRRAFNAPEWASIKEDVLMPQQGQIIH